MDVGLGGDEGCARDGSMVKSSLMSSNFTWVMNLAGLSLVNPASKSLPEGGRVQRKVIDGLRELLLRKLFGRIHDDRRSIESRILDGEQSRLGAAPLGSSFEEPKLMACGLRAKAATCRERHRKP
jgi:hypothetical protein